MSAFLRVYIFIYVGPSFSFHSVFHSLPAFVGIFLPLPRPVGPDLPLFLARLLSLSFLVLSVRYLFNPNTLEFALRECRHVMQVTAVIMVVHVLNLLTSLLRHFDENNETLGRSHYERLLTYAIAWGVGGLFEPEYRTKFDLFLKNQCGVPYPCEEGLTLYEYYVDQRTKEFQKWTTSEWQPPPGNLTFSSILIPTTDSKR